MGGSSSKEGKEDKKNKANNISSIDSPVNYLTQSNKKGEGKMQVLEQISSSKQKPKAEGSKKVIKISETEANLSFLYSLVEMVLRTEKMAHVFEDPEEVGEPLSTSTSTAKNLFLVRSVYEIISKKFEGTLIHKFVAGLFEILEANPGSTKYDLFLLCLLSSYRSLKSPQMLESTVDLKEAIKEILLDREASDYQGTSWERPVRALVSDITKLSGEKVLDYVDFEPAFNQAKSQFSKIRDEDIVIENFEFTLRSIQTWIYVETEAIEDSQAWKTIVNLSRKVAHSHLSGEFMNEKYCCPFSVEVPFCLKFNSYRYTYNNVVGTINFGSSFLLSRKIDSFGIQYYVGEGRVVVRAVTLNVGLVMRGYSFNGTEHEKYMPTFERLVKVLSHHDSEAELQHDFDMIAVLSNHSHYFFAHKQDLIHKFVDEGNVDSIKLYFSNDKSYLDKNSVKIILKNKDSHYGETMGEYIQLLIAKREDTLSVLITKLKNLYFDAENGEFSPEFLSHLFSTLVVSTRSKLSRGEYKEERSKSISKKYNATTLIDDILREVRDLDPYWSEDKQLVDLVFYIDFTGHDNYLSVMSPPQIDTDYQNENKISMKYELSDVINLTLGFAGFNSEYASGLSDSMLFDVLPAYLYVNVTNISSLLQVPQDLSLDFLHDVIRERDMYITNSYTVLSYQCVLNKGQYYIAKVDSSKPDEATAIIEDREVTVKLSKLNMDKIVGIMFVRREPDL